MNYNINNLAYEDSCAGAPAIDQSSTDENINDYISVGISDIYAQKFIPTSKCLSSIVLKLKKVIPSANATIYISEDAIGFPNFPASQIGVSTIESSELSDTYAEVNFPFNIILPNLNPLWIVISSMYDPNHPFPEEMLNIAAISRLSETNSAIKVENNSWAYTTRKPVFKTFKNTEGSLKWKCVDKTNNVCESGIDTSYTFSSESTCKDAAECKPDANNEGSTSSSLLIAVVGLGILGAIILSKKNKKSKK